MLEQSCCFLLKTISNEKSFITLLPEVSSNLVKKFILKRNEPLIPSLEIKLFYGFRSARFPNPDKMVLTREDKLLTTIYIIFHELLVI